MKGTIQAFCSQGILLLSACLPLRGPVTFGAEDDTGKLPSAYGTYAILGDKLVEFKPGQPAPDLPPKVELLVYDKPVSQLSASSIELRTLSYVRYKVVGSSFAPIDVSKDLRHVRIFWEEKDKWQYVKAESREVPIRAMPVENHPDMIRLVPQETLKPGVYELIYPVTLGRFFIARFSVDAAKIDVSSVAVDAYFDNAFATRLGEGMATYRSGAVLDVGLLNKWETLLARFRDKPAATPKEVEAVKRSDRTYLQTASVKMGLFTDRYRRFKKLWDDGQSAIANGEYRKAAECYESLREMIVARDRRPMAALRGTDDYESPANLALAYCKLGYPNTAIEYAATAMEKCRHPIMLLVVSACYRMHGKADESSFWFEKCLKAGVLDRTYIEKNFPGECCGPSNQALVEQYFPAH